MLLCTAFLSYKGNSKINSISPLTPLNKRYSLTTLETDMVLTKNELFKEKFLAKLPKVHLSNYLAQGNHQKVYKHTGAK